MSWKLAGTQYGLAETKHKNQDIPSSWHCLKEYSLWRLNTECQLDRLQDRPEDEPLGMFVTELLDRVCWGESIHLKYGQPCGLGWGASWNEMGDWAKHQFPDCGCRVTGAPCPCHKDVPTVLHCTFKTWAEKDPSFLKGYVSIGQCNSHRAGTEYVIL